MRATLRPLLAIVVALGLLMLAACGGDADGDEADATPATAAATATRAPGATTTPGSAATGISLCDANESPNGNDQTVAPLPADDPDGGLVVHAGAGTSTPELGVLPSGTALITTSDPAACAALSDGSVWWRVVSADGATDGWVNARFLTRSPAQEAARRDELCRTYAEVLRYESGPVDGRNFAPGALIADLRNLLDGPPPGVVDALDRVASPADEADLAEAYATLRGYVGPICT